MTFSIDIGNSKPVYQQLIDQIKLAIALGRLQPGDRLPSIRDVAVQVRANRNTVARVYSELEREGVIYTRTGQGAFISDKGSLLKSTEQRRQLTELLEAMLAQANLYGLSRTEIEQIMRDSLDRFFPAYEPAQASAAQSHDNSQEKGL